jgi:hypothetical protein
MNTIRFSAAKKYSICSLLVLAATFTFSPNAQAQRSWGPATRGTVIGAGVGGAAGALIHKKNPVVGAVVGGTVGAVAGNQIGKKQRRRWSPQAKGAVIGAGTGAAAGAIIHKRNRALGGVVGGVAGAAGGYAIGKGIDNRNKRRAAEEAARRAEAERIAKASEPDFQGSSPAMLPVQKPAPARSSAMVAYQQAPQTADGLTTVPFGYLPNPDYGILSAAYPTTEYRQKSW